MLIPEQKIEEVLDRVDIVALISRHVQLKKAGRSFKGCCPFHEEKTPSFHVTPEMRRFKCFGCQAGGDAIAFVQRFSGKTFVDAVRELAKEAGVDLEAAVDPSAKERAQLKEATDAAFEHFRSRLWEAPGKKARDYLAQRGVSEDVARTFGFGWAPLAWSDLADRLTQLGLLDHGVRAGLIAKRPRGDGYYDLFRGRLIIPIRSPEGRTIAFGGRLLESAPGQEPGPKYLNSRESKLYNKSETLYGLDLAKDEVRRQKSAVLVEGYFDCVGIHQAGIRNVVALCSTALTPGHLRLLERSEAKELVLFLDGDEAGRKAVERLAGPLFAAGTTARVAVLPEGEDPDTFARRVGPEQVRALLSRATPLSEHLFKTVLPKGMSASFEEKMAALDRLRPITQQLPVGLTRSAFFASLASHLGLAASELEAALRGKTPSTKPAPKEPERPPPPRPARRPPELEALFVAIVLEEPSLRAGESSSVETELTHVGLRGVLASARAGLSSQDALMESPPEVKSALEVAARQLRGSPDLTELFRRVCRTLRLRRIDDQLSHIAHATRAAEGGEELSEEVRRLLSERSELLALKRKVLEEGV